MILRRVYRAVSSGSLWTLLMTLSGPLAVQCRPHATELEAFLRPSRLPASPLRITTPTAGEDATIAVSMLPEDALLVIAERVQEPLSEVDMQMYQQQALVGTIAGFLPFTIAAFEFNKRIQTQRACRRCSGSGLIMTQNGKERRCPTCGGFVPFKSWSEFWNPRRWNQS
ncbi:unnamed protein product [Vitrella brassicaformis CCMP3155]|uniref:Viral late gene transcription factor 3 zinc ribbon domain-containing protein n=2 Tax=Vitrella brassicaformis TaxID=1169539 RepID=A0A0G4F8D4_VITBC|nr:unnamed protein product [Vitrella brassicaformis CCMP3155]|eukprot:CEM08635.1 unnamed protein product [Vitrella brassicaformis CCMP3155]